MRLEGHDQEQKLEQMKEIQEAASTASVELRATIHNLSSSKGGNSSWIGIIKSQLANQAKLNGIDIVFHAPNPKSGNLLSINHQKALYRTILEGVGNAIRHGASSLVHVDLSLKQGAVTLAIEDNGIGFDVRSKTNKTNSGFGLANMRALAVSLGGTFDIESKEGSGTRILLWLPSGQYRQCKRRNQSNYEKRVNSVRVVIVDDHPLVRKGLIAVLRTKKKSKSSEFPIASKRRCKYRTDGA